MVVTYSGLASVTGCGGGGAKRTEGGESGASSHATRRRENRLPNEASLQAFPSLLRPFAKP